MRKEDLKNWTREQMKSEILRLHRKLELFGIKFEENPNNFSFSYNGNRYYAGKLVNDYAALKEENSLIKSEYNDSIISFNNISTDNKNLRKRLEKLESGICGGSPCIVSEFHSFEGESWIRATTYDDVLLRLKKANERITDLEQDIFNKSTDELKQVEKLSSENKSLKDENKALKQRIKGSEDVCDGSFFSDEEDERDKLIAELQDQHQQDCIRYNDMRTAYLVALDELARLREQFGIGR